MPDSFPHAYRPRELRREINVRARMRASNGWTDACILNVSSHGLQISAVRAAVHGRTVEIWHGEHVIVAQVVWRKGTRAGLRAERRVPVEELMKLSQTPQLQLTAGPWTGAERRRRPRAYENSCLRERLIQLAGMAVVAASVAAGAVAMIDEALTGPFAYLQAALRG